MIIIPDCLDNLENEMEKALKYLEREEISD